MNLGRIKARRSIQRSWGVAIALAFVACQKDPVATTPPAPTTSPPLVRRASESAGPSTKGGAKGTDTSGKTLGPDPLQAPGSSPVLQRFIATPEHRKLASLARTMLGQVDSGKCGDAMAGAKDLAGAIRAAGGEFRLTDLKEMAQRIQADPHFMDKEYMAYKSTLVGLAVGIEFAPLGFNLAASDPKARANACDRFASQLREIRQPE
jgi:hypothetical protein